MKMLLKDGCVDNFNNTKSIIFPKNDDYVDEKFNQSLSNVVRLIDGYDIGKCGLNSNKDIFYLYSFLTNCEEIDNSLRKALLGYERVILNEKETDLLESINNDNQNGIYWDVLNDLIIVIGLDNLKTFLLQLERKRWECIQFRDEEFKKEYMNLCASKVYRKVMKPA